MLYRPDNTANLHEMCCRGKTSLIELVTQTRLVLMRLWFLVLEAHGVCRLLVSVPVLS